MAMPSVTVTPSDPGHRFSVTFPSKDAEDRAMAMFLQTAVDSGGEIHPLNWASLVKLWQDFRKS